LPVDLRLVFDTSGSISDDELARYLKMMQRVAQSLDKDDRGEIITFTTKLAEAAERRHPPLVVHLERNGPEGTAFFDAGLAALTTVAMADRRQMAILLSDAVDNASFFDEETLLKLRAGPTRRLHRVARRFLKGAPCRNSVSTIASYRHRRTSHRDGAVRRGERDHPKGIGKSARVLWL
jgi:hypothetical protein